MRTMRILLLMIGAVPLVGESARADKLVLFAGGGDEDVTSRTAVDPTKAKLNQPFAIESDKAGRFYVAEMTGDRVLLLSPRRDEEGRRPGLSLFAGTGKRGDKGDGLPAVEASFNGMHNLAVTPDGTVYLADTWNQRIRKIDPKTRIVTAFAGTGKKGYSGDGGPALKADFGGVYCLAFNHDFSKMVVTDLDNRRIRVIDMTTGVVDLVAGNGKKGVPQDGADARDAPLVDPRAACVDRQGNLWILERGGHALRVVDAQGKIRTAAGTGKAGNTGDDGDARQATLNGPKHLCVDLKDNVIIADSGNHVIRRYTPADGKITRIAGSGKKGNSGMGGEPLAVSFNEPHGVYVSPAGSLFIVDSLNNRIFRWEK